MFRYRDTSNEGHTTSVAWRRAHARRSKVPTTQRPQVRPDGFDLSPGGDSTTPASPSGEAGAVLIAGLQRNPDSEEPEPPLVESGIPHGRLLVAPVVDRAVSPLPARRGEWPVPVGSRRFAGSPRRRPVAPRRPAEVAPLRVSVPRTAGPTGPARVIGSAGTTRAAGPTGMVGSARTAGAAGGPTRAAGSARSTRAARPTRSARITGCVRWMDTRGRGPAVTAGRAGRRPARSGVGRSGAHTQCRGAQRAGDGDPPK